MKKIVVLMLLSLSFMFALTDLNRASKDELMSIKGIGEKKAQRIIEFRQKKRFNSVQELNEVKGFGLKLINKIKDKVEVKQNNTKS